MAISTELLGHRKCVCVCVCVCVCIQAYFHYHITVFPLGLQLRGGGGGGIFDMAYFLTCTLCLVVTCVGSYEIH